MLSELSISDSSCARESESKGGVEVGLHNERQGPGELLEVEG